jgi:uncharacterized membrane protein YqiK
MSLTLIAIGIIFLILLVLVITYTKLYKTTTPDIALVITGLGKTKVIINGGKLVIPGFQEVTPVSLKTLKIDISKKDNEALFTQDVHANIEATFFIKVKNSEEHIKKAAESLGGKALSNINELKILLDAKFAGSLRSIAANMTLKELQEQRIEFTKKVQESLSTELEKNGLYLESVDITHLNQTDPSKLPENDIFAARSRSITAKEVQTRKKEENEVIRDTEVSIEIKDVETLKKKNELSKEKEASRLDMEKTKSDLNTDQKINEAKNTAKQESETATAQYATETNIAKAKINTFRETEEAKITADVAIANKSKDRSEAEKSANIAIKERVASEEAIITTKEISIDERNKNVSVIKASEEVETDAVKIERLSQANLTEKINEAKGIEVIANANKTHYEVEAEGKTKINKAENELSIDIIKFKLTSSTIENAAAIISALVEPAKHIKNLHVVQAQGMFGGGSGSSGESKSAIEGVFDASLQNTIKSGVIHDLLEKAGIDIKNPKSILDKMQPQLVIPTTTPSNNIDENQ